MKLKEKQANFISIFLLALIMTCIVTLTMALLNGNFVFTKWLKGWLLSFLVAFPTILVLMPNIRKFVFKFVKKN